MMFPLRPPFIGFPSTNFFPYQSTAYYKKKKLYENTYSNSEGQNNIKSDESLKSSSLIAKKKPLSELEEDYFFELFGIKLFFDDILLICLLFFLYEEGARDTELFICLILLLLS